MLESAPMRPRSLPGKLGAVALATAAAMLGTMSSASAQVMVSPNAEPSRNDGGWVYWIAVALAVLGVLVALAVATAYMRYAPRFQREEGAPRTVKAPRIQPGREAPRRPVNITGAPVVVPAPAMAAAPAAAPLASAAPATVPAPAAALPAPAASPPAPAPAAAPSAPAPAAPAPPPGEPPAAEEAATAPAAEPAAPAPPPSAAAGGGEHKEVSLDQETFDRVLAELLEKGTTRRVAEGQARRAAMIAARKKAGG